MNRKTCGFWLGAIGAATYGMNPLFALPLYGAGMDTDSVLFWRYLLGAVFLGLVMRLRGQSLAAPRACLAALVAGGALTAVSSLTLFLSYRRMDAGVASTILFVYPVMVAAIMTVFFREKITPARVLSLFLALGGIALLYRGDDDRPLSLTGVALVLVSALSYAMFMVGVRQSKLRDLSGERVAFYTLLFGLLLFWARADFGFSLMVPATAGSWANAVGLALFPTVLSLTFTAMAVGMAGPTPTAILGALEPLTAVAIGVAVFGEALTGRLCAGMATIIAAVTLLVLFPGGGTQAPGPSTATEPPGGT